MSERVRCPECGKVVAAEPGRSAVCPACGARFKATSECNLRALAALAGDTHFQESVANGRHRGTSCQAPPRLPTAATEE